MKKGGFIFPVVISVVTSCQISGKKELPNTPNIILVMADDQGWDDAGWIMILWKAMTWLYRKKPGPIVC